jgi:hypothetical protein
VLNETFGEVRIGKNFPSYISNSNGLKQGVALSSLLSSFALVYAIRNVQEKQLGLKLNGTHLMLVYADDLNLLEQHFSTCGQR